MSASQIVPGLWVGSVPYLEPSLKRHCDVVLLAAREYQPTPRSSDVGGVDVLHFPMDDDHKQMPARDKKNAIEAAQSVVQAMKAGKKVLVTCFMGLNRSGLIASLTLMLGPLKMSADEAVARVRHARGPHAVNNPHFLHLLKLVESSRKPS